MGRDSSKKAPSGARVRAAVVSRRGFLGGGAALAGGVAVGAVWLGGVGLAGCAEPEDAQKLTPEGTIPPVTANEDFYVTSCCGTPVVDALSWALVVKVGGEEAARIDLAGLSALAAGEKEHTLECISGGPYNLAIGNAVWGGWRLAELFATLGVTVPAEAVELKFTSADDYTTSVPVGDLGAIWLVTTMNGAPLPAEHGYPARLLVPGRYGMKNPKWLVEIDLVAAPYVGFWEERGWSNEATYKPNALVHLPTRLEAEVEAGPARILGSAFAGSDPVARVEVRIDDGDWTDATLDYAPGADIWTLWHHDVELAVGAHTVRVRATTASGATTGDPEGTGGLAGYDGGMELAIEAV